MASVTEFKGGAACAPSPARATTVMSRTPHPEFRALYEAHFDFVWRALRRLGVREPDVLDLAQKVFLTAHFKLAEFEGRSLISTWLFGIAQRVASDYRRSALIRREVSTDNAELEAVASWHEDFSAESDSGRRARAAEAILNKLPEPQRTVFVFFELEEMSGEDIATLLNISVGTVRSRLRLAREAFRREVKRLSAIDASGRKEAV
ncbi:MAG: RNA polymerase sigma factor [Polyangiaceae bacterium]